MYKSADDALSHAARVMQCPVIDAGAAYSLAARARRAAGSGLSPMEAHGDAALVADVVLRAVAPSEAAWIAARYWKIFHIDPPPSVALEAARRLRVIVICALPTGVHSTRGVDALIRNCFLPRADENHQAHPLRMTVGELEEEFGVVRQSVFRYARTVRQTVWRVGVLAMAKAHGALEAARFIEAAA